jgi:uncharacterized protein YigA (DUF484 family)
VLAALPWIGTLPGWLTLGGIAVLVFLLRGGQVGPALGYLREANAVLEKEVETLKTTAKEQTKEIERLRATREIEPLAKAIVDEVRNHDQRAQERFEQTTSILRLIADRLGPDS